MKSRKVLVADDEVHIVQVIAMKLRNNGFEVVTAESGTEAYKVCCRENPDVIIADYHMPEMDGIQLIEKIRANTDLKHMPIIMLTAKGFTIDEKLRQKLQISECLNKPFSLKELLGHVEEVLLSSPATK